MNIQGCLVTNKSQIWVIKPHDLIISRPVVNLANLENRIKPYYTRSDRIFQFLEDITPQFKANQNRINIHISGYIQFFNLRSCQIRKFSPRCEIFRWFWIKFRQFSKVLNVQKFIENISDVRFLRSWISNTKKPY